MATDWEKLAVKRYVKDVAEYERRVEAGIERGRAIRAQMEGILAVRYDRDGGRAGYEDHRPEALDLLAEIADKLDADIVLWAEDHDRALELFEKYAETRIVWEKWGKRQTWSHVARDQHYCESMCRRMAERGIEIIYHDMPEQYRRSPVPAQPWQYEQK